MLPPPPLPTVGVAVGENLLRGGGRVSAVFPIEILLVVVVRILETDRFSRRIIKKKLKISRSLCAALRFPLSQIDDVWDY